MSFSLRSERCCKYHLGPPILTIGGRFALVIHHLCSFQLLFLKSIPKIKVVSFYPHSISDLVVLMSIVLQLVMKLKRDACVTFHVLKFCRLGHHKEVASASFAKVIFVSFSVLHDLLIEMYEVSLRNCISKGNYHLVILITFAFIKNCNTSCIVKRKLFPKRNLNHLNKFFVILTNLC